MAFALHKGIHASYGGSNCTGHLRSYSRHSAVKSLTVNNSVAVAVAPAAPVQLTHAEAPSKRPDTSKVRPRVLRTTHSTASPTILGNAVTALSKVSEHHERLCTTLSTEGAVTVVLQACKPAGSIGGSGASPSA